MTSDHDIIGAIRTASSQAPVLDIQPSSVRAQATWSRPHRRRRNFLAVAAILAVIITMSLRFAFGRSSPSNAPHIPSTPVLIGPPCATAVSAKLLNADSTSGVPTVYLNGPGIVQGAITFSSPVLVSTFELAVGVPTSVAAAGDAPPSERPSGVELPPNGLDPKNQIASASISEVTSTEDSVVTVKTGDLAPGTYPILSSIAYEDRSKSCEGGTTSDEAVQQLGQLVVILK